jgi:hypothetical protein
MSNITISDMHSTDFTMLSNSESYMREVSDEELYALTGGGLLSLDSFTIGLVLSGGAFIGGGIAAGISLLFDALFD